MEELKEILGILTQSLLEDREKLKTCFHINDIAETRRILERLNGTFCYCIVPTLQNARGVLDHAVQKTTQLHALGVLFDAFYREIDRFLINSYKLKADGVL